MSVKCWCGTGVCSICNPPKILTPEEQERKIKHDLWKGQIDTQRLEKLEAYIKESSGVISFMTSGDSITICEEINRHDFFPGAGVDLRSAIDSLKVV